MKIETPQPETFARAAETETVTCPNCGAELARGMRFCRLCGYRLGEGLAEYVETVRLNSIGGLGPVPAAGPLARAAAAQAVTTQLSAAQAAALDAAATAERRGARHRRRARALRWLLVPVALVAVTTGGILFVSDMTRRPGTRVSAPAAPRSFFGGDEFERVEGGLMVEAVLPGGPAEAAGMQDGDVLVRFDGAEIESEGDLRDVLRATPVGKTVEVEYLRDGEPGRTLLTTIPSNAYNARAFMPSNGSGYWGVDGLRRVAVEGTKMHGVRLGSVSSNRPADIAGLKEGDIVIEFGGRPVRTRNGLSSYIDHAAPGTVVNVTVIRDGRRIDIPVKMGKD